MSKIIEYPSPEDLGNLAGVFSGPAIASSLSSADPSAWRAATRFWGSAYASPALSPRMKELVLVALHGTSTSLNAQAVRRHVKRALAAGASERDIIDVLITINGAANHALYFSIPVLQKEMKAMGHPDAEPSPITAEAQTIKDEFIRTRGFWNEQRDVIARMMPEYFAALSDISSESWKNGSLTDKERELICICIDCTVTHMFEPGLAIHIRNALNKGASRAEILEVFHLSAVIGLEGYILAAEAMFAPDSD